MSIHPARMMISLFLLKVDLLNIYIFNFTEIMSDIGLSTEFYFDFYWS